MEADNRAGQRLVIHSHLQELLSRSYLLLSVLLSFRVSLVHFSPLFTSVILPSS